MSLERAIKQAIDEGHTEMPTLCERLQELGHGKSTTKEVKTIMEFLLKEKKEKNAT